MDSAPNADGGFCFSRSGDGVRVYTIIFLSSLRRRWFGEGSDGFTGRDGVRAVRNGEASPYDFFVPTIFAGVMVVASVSLIRSCFGDV